MHRDRTSTAACRYDRISTKDYHLHCSAVGIHACVIYFAAISLPNPLITHDKTQQRDKIAVKINDLKQKHAEPNQIWGKHIHILYKRGSNTNEKNEERAGATNAWKQMRAMWIVESWMVCFEVQRMRAHISFRRKHARNSQHISFVSLNSHKILRVLMFYGVLLFQCWQLTTAMITMVAIAIKWRIFKHRKLFPILWLSSSSSHHHLLYVCLCADLMALRLMESICDNAVKERDFVCWF